MLISSVPTKITSSHRQNIPVLIIRELIDNNFNSFLYLASTVCVGTEIWSGTNSISPGTLICTRLCLC